MSLAHEEVSRVVNRNVCAISPRFETRTGIPKPNTSSSRVVDFEL